MTVPERPVRRPVPASVLDAFGVSGDPEPLTGGQGTAWSVGGVVLKPADLPGEEATWRAEVFERLERSGFRVARPHRARDGSLVVEGWMAEELLSGRHEQRWPEIIAAGERFHSALAGEPRPSFLDSRQDAWAIGDRVAWEELPATDFARVPHLSRLVALRRRLEGAAQLVHGDLGGNVLFADPEPPAVIDFSPYWRPPAFASAIVIADALVWEGADESILGAVSHVPDFPQYLLRALIYRAVTARLFFESGRAETDEADHFAPVVDLAVRLARG